MPSQVDMSSNSLKKEGVSTEERGSEYHSRVEGEEGHVKWTSPTTY